jgi:hypothetical protein
MKGFPGDIENHGIEPIGFLFSPWNALCTSGDSHCDRRDVGLHPSDLDAKDGGILRPERVVEQRVYPGLAR